MTLDPRLCAPWNGVVLDNEDPLGLYRVRVSIPGLIEKSAWAFPVGTMGGGSAKRGGWIVPKVGADVVIWFLGGDPERPIYQGGWWGIPEAGSEMSSGVEGVEAKQVQKVQTLELDQIRIVVDEREEKMLFSIEDKTTGDALTWDLKKAMMQIKLTAGLLLKCDGVIDIDALQVFINKRLVSTTGKAI